MQTKLSTLQKREEINPSFKWNLEKIYKSKTEWEKDIQQVKLYMKEILLFKGTLKDNSSNLLNCLKKYDSLLSLADKIYVYARMKKDENNENAPSLELSQKAELLVTEVLASVSFITPEIISIPNDIIEDFLSKNDDLRLYKTYLNEISRQKNHILTEKEEALLSLANDVTNISKNTFSMFNNADIKFPFINDENGNKIELTKGRYISLMESKNRNVRKVVFKNLYKAYSSNKNTLASLLFGNIKCKRFYSTARKYNSSLESSLFKDNVGVEIYDNLIDTVSNNIHLLTRYLKLRKKALKLKELHMYDLYVPLFPDISANIEFDQAKTMVREGLAPLGKDYCEHLDEAFSNNWIDVYENKGKTSGAYSWGCYLSDPYVLLNYQGKLNDVFTLAHEMGHAMHSYYTNKNQPYIYSEYKIFVAEVASTVNESLMTSYLLQKSSNKNERAFILNHFLEEFRGTIFRQTMFAEFEKIIHKRVEQSESLSCDVLSDIYYNLNKKYYGEVVNIDREISLEWSRIPHFYNSFYVYKYATGMSSALSLSKNILSGNNKSLNNYLQFLKSGSSQYPLDLLRNAGVDLSTRAPIEDGFKIFEKHLNELEECL
jgi:oligoendopeptidase F